MDPDKRQRRPWCVLHGSSDPAKALGVQIWDLGEWIVGAVVGEKPDLGFVWTDDGLGEHSCGCVSGQADDVRWRMDRTTAGWFSVAGRL